MLEQLLLSTLLVFGADTSTLPPTTTETTETSETTTSESEITTSDITYEESEKDVIETLKEWLSQMFDSNLVGFIINWAIDAGLITVIAGIYFKYRKYKAKSSQEIASEVKEVVKEVLKDRFKDLSNQQQKEIIEKIEKFEGDLDKLKKALVLAQDRTAEGKIALLNLINETSENKTDIKEVSEKVETQIKKEVEKEKKVNEKVKDDYQPVD